MIAIGNFSGVRLIIDTPRGIFSIQLAAREVMRLQSIVGTDKLERLEESITEQIQELEDYNGDS